MGTLNKALVMVVGTMLAMSNSHVAHAAGNVNVEADSMEIIDADHKTVFRGNVVAKRPTDTIKADEMTVVSADEKQADGTMKSVTDHVDAKGNVTINTRDAVITGDSAKFDVAHDQLEVDGTVKVVQGTSVIHGQKLNVDLKTFHLNMAGGRVSGNFTPN